MPKRHKRSKNASEWDDPKAQADEDMLRWEADTIERDMKCWWCMVRSLMGCGWTLLVVFLCTLVSVLVMASGVWAVSELDAVMDIYSTQCANDSCRATGVTYSKWAREMSPCSRMSAARCVLIPVQWVFVPMLPVYAWATHGDEYTIQEQLPMLLDKRCRMCYGVSFVR